MVRTTFFQYLSLLFYLSNDGYFFFLNNKLTFSCYVSNSGGPTAALIAYHNPHIAVNVVDLNAERIAAWNSNHLPIHETGLPKIVRVARDGTQESQIILAKDASSPSSSSPASASSIIHLEARTPNLRFSCNVTAAISEADIIFVCVNTPTKMYGVGAGASADLGALEAATRTIAKNAKAGAVVVEKSTVPCGTARIIQSIVSFYSSMFVPPFLCVCMRRCEREKKHSLSFVVFCWRGVLFPSTCLCALRLSRYFDDTVSVARDDRSQSKQTNKWFETLANTTVNQCKKHSSSSTVPKHILRCFPTQSSSPRAPPSPT